MKSSNYRSINKWFGLQVALVLLLMPLAAFGQTKISYHKNKFKPEDDVRLGRQTAAEAERKLQVIPDPQLTAYVERVGERLVAAIPQEFQHPEFHYYFKVVNAREINAFALPGGPMYVNTGMIQAARTEGEMAGVMAHEISHGFDELGNIYDAQGRLGNWWTAEDLANYHTAAANIVAQFDGYCPLPDLCLKGRQVLGENIADLAGLLVGSQTPLHLLRP